MNFCSLNTKELSDVDIEEKVVVFDQFSNYSSFDEERISSASGSLKWSCDVENQNNNKNDWELIENIFYGEEKLPEGKVIDFLRKIFVLFLIFVDFR